MNLRNDTPAARTRRRFGLLLSRRDWVYVLGLLVPLILYNLTLKAVRVASLPGDHGLLSSLSLMRSDLLFNLGYALLWIGLFAVVRGGLPRLAVVALFHASAILVALVTTGAHRFFVVTGSTLDAATILFFLSSPGEVGSIAASELTAPLAVTVLVALGYVIFGPLLLVRLVFGRRGASGESEAPAGSWLGLSLIHISEPTRPY